MNINSTDCQLTTKEKRAVYMSRLRGAIDSEYRRIERENNARAMRKKRLENPLYREQERRQNRQHMAKIRRENPDYKQKEHIKNRHRMELKRRLLSPTSSNNKNNNQTRKLTSNSNSIYQTLENNLQSSHISFIPYQSNFDSYQQTEYNILKQIDEYCRQQDISSSSDNTTTSTSSC